MSDAVPRAPGPSVMIAGPLPPPLGGATVLTQQLVEFFTDDAELAVVVVNTSSGAGSSVRRMGARIAVPFEILRRLRDVQVVTVHLSSGGVWSLGLSAVVLARLAKRPVLLRRFGGTALLSGGLLRRMVSKWVLRSADLVLVETLNLMKEAGRIGRIDVEQFPNSRPLPAETSHFESRNGEPLRFAFLGQIRSEKGIRELIAAGERLGPLVSVDVFGPFGFDIDISEFDELDRVRYRGTLAPEHVASTLLSYDALAMPSLDAGEGHPGVIVEAYGAGLPVVASRLGSIPEIVDDKSGILIDPPYAESLFGAMRDLATDEVLLRRLSEAPRQRAECLDSEHWNRYFVDTCRELAERRT